MDLHSSLGGCYNTRATPWSGVCWEARDGACVGHVEEVQAEIKEKLSAGACEEVSGGGPNTCKTCGAVIGGMKYCSACNVDSSTESAPVDGQCTTENNECPNKANGMCTQCDHASFMFQGGCYSKDAAPGNTMCETTDSAGVCTQAKQGYFLPPTDDRDNTHQSVIPCGSEEEITVGNSHKYKGVLHCTQCDTPTAAGDTNAKAATCTACEDGYFVDTGNGNICSACAANCLTCTDGTATKCKSCTAETHFLGATGDGPGKCVSCGDVTGSGDWKGVTGCAKCTKPASAGPATCTECTGDLYLKTDGATSCVSAADCNNGFFPTTDSKNKKVCVKCSATDNGGIENCAKCSLKASSARAGAAVTCTECGSGKKLSPLKDACLDSCPAGTYDNTNVCTPCHTSCASCESNAEATSCTACYPGSVLNKIDSSTAGACIPECTGRYAENCEANQCTANIGGSKYCSRCKSGFVPVDGLCVSATARVLAGCTPSTTTAGTCESCKDAYFLESGGCYQAAVYPGNTLCTTTDSNGKCTDCANGQTADGSTGSCPTCPANCASCTGDSTKACTKCLSGYYLDSTAKTCKKCSENSADGKIQGVENCMSCKEPSGASGTVTCYVTQQSTDPSTNKGGLSSGAIAGISVAVIAVVGGLVGFLCWWFVYRGRA